MFLKICSFYLLVQDGNCISYSYIQLIVINTNLDCSSYHYSKYQINSQIFNVILRCTMYFLYIKKNKTVMLRNTCAFWLYCRNTFSLIVNDKKPQKCLNSSEFQESSLELKYFSFSIYHSLLFIPRLSSLIFLCIQQRSY